MDERYPIGRFTYSGLMTPELQGACRKELLLAPSQLRVAVAGLNEEQLDTPYRDGGWTVRQVVHHVPDSHLNAYVRMKLTLTEEKPTIRPYDEKKWAETPDVFNTAVEISLTLLESVHQRWMELWNALTDEDYRKVFIHPDHGERTLDWMLALYAWHGRHHTAHITTLRERMGWESGH